MSLSERELMDNREIYIFPIESRGGKPEDGLACFRLGVLALLTRCERDVVTWLSAEAMVL